MRTRDWRRSRRPRRTTRTRSRCGRTSRTPRRSPTTCGTRPSTISPSSTPRRATRRAHAPSWRKRAPSIPRSGLPRWHRDGTRCSARYASITSDAGMLKRIHHVGVVVPDLEAGLRFWRDTLGLHFTKSATIEEQGVKAALLKVGDSEIELLEPTNPDNGVGKFLARRGGGLHHLCFETDDVARELEGARAKGIQLIDQHPRHGLAGLICFLHPKATRGVLVEYAQPPEGEN